MKHNINFYFDEYKPKVQLLTFTNLLIACVFMIFLVGCVSAYTHHLSKQSAQQLKKMQQTVSNKKILVAEFETALKDRKLDPKLTALVAELQNKIQIKQQIMQQIERVTENQKSGYSILMSDIAGTIPQGIWLTGINFSDDEIALTGLSKQAHLLPQWLQNLGQSDYFRDQEFEQMELLNQSEQNLTQFQVVSTHSAGENP